MDITKLEVKDLFNYSNGELFWDKEVASQVIKIERLKLHKEFANHGY